ncbi:MAG: hypothetical protein JW850_23955 [Thermoflexales bacterium]|nr:hypothetical protein [Thermoflexales bacterium]
MSDYDRTTRECPVTQLRPELLQAIRDYFQTHELGDLEAETLACCETVSTQKGAGRLPAWLTGELDTIIYMGTLLTSQWLIWVRSGDRSGSLLTAANLKDIQVKVFTSTLTKDSGLEIVGYLEGSKGRIRGYIGMGPELATQTFFEQVKQAIAKANPPTPSRLPQWLRSALPPS